jgi:pyruvate formate lyase activating enzyme
MIQNKYPMKKADLYSIQKDKIRCQLCCHHCLIAEGKTGICRVRKNIDGVLFAETYGMISSKAVDPIEKKPLYHFLPHTKSYSLGSVGCNFTCSHCQNWHISQPELYNSALSYLPAEEGVLQAQNTGCSSISWTYNEPTLSYEYTKEMGMIAKKKGLKTIYVTNGYMTEEALQGLGGILDAFRVDIKAFSDAFYKNICGGKLTPVLDATRIAHEQKMHIETVTLIIPGLNDDIQELEQMISWVIEEIGPYTPMHFTRFHPDHKMMNIPSTPLPVLEKIYNRAKELGLLFPYIGNVLEHPYEHTYCPSCGSILIKRSGFYSDTSGLDKNACRNCGEQIPIIIP